MIDSKDWRYKKIWKIFFDEYQSLKEGIERDIFIKNKDINSEYVVSTSNITYLFDIIILYILLPELNYRKTCVFDLWRVNIQLDVKDSWQSLWISSFVKARSMLSHALIECHLRTLYFYLTKFKEIWIKKILLTFSLKQYRYNMNNISR